jgi:Fe-S-cluster-containing dehydrogenase component
MPEKKLKYGMVIDLKRCIGCDTCTMACRAENATSKGVLFNRVHKFEVRRNSGKTGLWSLIRTNAWVANIAW